MWKKIYNESADESVKLIDTGLVGDKAKDILDSVIGQLSDGKWENSPAMEHYWPFIDVEMKGRRVYFAVSTKPWRKNYGKDNWFAKVNFDEKAIKVWMAEKLKEVAKQELKDDPDLGDWDRDNVEETGYLSYDKPITFQEVYFAYEILKDRDCLRKYPEEVVAEMLG